MLIKQRMSTVFDISALRFNLLIILIQQNKNDYSRPQRCKGYLFSNQNERALNIWTTDDDYSRHSIFL